ncbi:MAG: UvrD-helicase domain-containing protein [Spirochaetales bacterium]|nr:UvrD-helicase domain-containing protein [Spirochaetales bacterium]
MRYIVLLNHSLKSYLLTMGQNKKKRFQEKLEFLEAGILDSGVKVKKLKGISGKVIFEARLSRGDRILFTMGRYADQTAIYLWGIVKHDDISDKAKNILPDNAPFLNFQPVESEEYEEIMLEDLKQEYFSQEALEEKALEDYGPQKWLVLDDSEWERILKNSDPDNFELFLYLTREQQEVLRNPTPVLLSGTAGSGKTTISVYYLLDKEFSDKNKLYLTYSLYLKRFSKKIYDGLIKDRQLEKDTRMPQFFAFPELLADIFSKANAAFHPDKLVGLKEFEQIFKNHQLYKKYDSELVWEEIRSIIKGANPQISVKRLNHLISRYLNKTLSGRELPELKDFLLNLKNYEFIIKIERAIEKKTKFSSFEQFLASFPPEKGTLLNDEQFILGELLKILEKKSHSFSHPLLTCTEYENLGRKRAPNFLYDRAVIYSIAEYYQNELTARGLKDEIDCCREAISFLTKDNGGQLYDLIVCDEVQDFTDIQLSLIFKLAGDFRNILFAGDPRQIINPSGFRWEELKAKFYERNIVVPRVFNLRLNFRCVGNLVRLANELLDLKKELVGLAGSEFIEDWKFNGRPPLVIHQIKEEELLENLRIQGAGQIILVRDKKQKKYLQDTLETSLVFTINEAKGLEFSTVFLWKFSCNKKNLDLWRKIYNEHHLDLSHFPHVKHELNLLYVAVTRARNTLIVYDGETASYIWQMERIKQHFYWTENPDELHELWQHISTPSEWEAQGDYFLEREYYKAAFECYKNSDNNVKKEKAFAFILVKEGKYQEAAPLFLKSGLIKDAAECYEYLACYEQALKLWQQLKNKKRVHHCRILLLEQSKEYDKAADEWITLNRMDMALKNWERSNNYRKLADYYYAGKDYSKAALYFEKKEDFSNAALCYKKLKNNKKTAEMFFIAGDYRTAALFFKKCKNSEEMVKCYKKLNDYLPIAILCEKNKDITGALEWLRKYANLSEENREYLVTETNKYKKSSLKAALRYSAAGLCRESAPVFMKKGYFKLAIDDYQTLNDHESLSECYRGIGDFLNAAMEMEQTDILIKWEKSKSLLTDYVYVNNKYNQPHADKLYKQASVYLQKNDYIPALVRYQAINYQDGIVDIYLKMDQDEKAITYLLDNDSKNFDMLKKYLNIKSELTFSFTFLDYLLKRLCYSGFYYSMDREKAIILTTILQYVKTNKDPGIPRILETQLKNDLYSFHLDKSFTQIFIDILFETKAYNLIYIYINSYSFRMAKGDSLSIKKDFLKHCRELGEKNNDKNFLACYYSVCDYLKYGELIQDMEITEENHRIFEGCKNESDRLIEYYMARSDYESAINIGTRFKKHAFVASVYEKTGDYKKAGTYFRDIKKYDKALEFFKKADDKINIARTYEKLHQFSKAMEIWKQLGKTKEIGRLKAKMIKLNIPVTEVKYEEQELF